MRLLEVEFACLRDYELRRAEIDDDCRIHLMARINVPHNSHKAARDAVVVRADKILAAGKLLGFHCTRLTPQEIDQVRQAGRKPLSSTLLKDRLDRAMNQGYFSQELPNSFGQNIKRKTEGGLE